jgi:phosphatidylglycerophosphatase A
MLALLPLPCYGLVLVGCVAGGIWTSEKAAHLYGQHDPPCVVIDEIAGMLLTYFSLPVAWLPVLTGFVFFRVFDIVKPIPQLERLPGGWGIMLDDLCAGVFAHASVRLVLWLMQPEGAP